MMSKTMVESERPQLTI